MPCPHWSVADLKINLTMAWFMGHEILVILRALPLFEGLVNKSCDQVKYISQIYFYCASLRDVA